VRQRRDLYADTAAFADTQCCFGSDQVDVSYRLAVAFPYGHGDGHGDGHGGRAARPGYAASEDFACCNGPRCLVLPA
jgi:hypothetical protein